VHVEQPVKHAWQELPIKKYPDKQTLQASDALEVHVEQPVKHGLQRLPFIKYPDKQVLHTA
jgi:hypothetical protein